MQHLSWWLLLILAISARLPPGVSGQTPPASSPAVSKPKPDESPTFVQDAWRDSFISTKEIIALVGAVVGILVAVVAVLSSLRTFRRAALTDKSVIEVIGRQGGFVTDEKLDQVKKTLGDLEVNHGKLEGKMSSPQQPAFDDFVRMLPSPEDYKTRQVFGSPVGGIADESDERKANRVQQLLKEIESFHTKRPRTPLDPSGRGAGGDGTDRESRRKSASFQPPQSAP